MAQPRLASVIPAASSWRRQPLPARASARSHAHAAACGPHPRWSAGVSLCGCAGSEFPLAIAVW
jgi:hypothetical protein